MHLSFYMFIYFGKIDLLDTWYFSKIKFPQTSLVNALMSRLHIAELNLRNLCSFGHFQLQTAVSLAKNSTCVLAHSLTLFDNALGRCDAHATNDRLSDGSVAITGSFLYFFCGAMAWLSHCQIQHKWI